MRSLCVLKSVFNQSKVVFQLCSMVIASKPPSHVGGFLLGKNSRRPDSEIRKYLPRLCISSVHLLCSGLWTSGRLLAFYGEKLLCGGLGDQTTSGPSSDEY